MTIDDYHFFPHTLKQYGIDGTWFCPVNHAIMVLVESLIVFPGTLIEKATHKK